MKSFMLKSKSNNVGIGDDFPIRVNCNVGTTKDKCFKSEVYKIKKIISDSNTLPDIMMDLSIIEDKQPLYQYIYDKCDIPVGTVPVYLSFTKDYGITKSSLLKHIEMQANSGVAFFTLHITPSIELYKIALRTRKIPLTSRGGSLVMYDLLKNQRKSNIIEECIEDILEIVKNYKIAISLGTTFRPAGIVDALDEVHLLETKEQLKWCRYIQMQGVDVIVENVGHIDIQDISKHANLLKEFDAPIMPLGPITTDNAIGNDHIAASIGSSFMGYMGCAHIINSISPCEHSKPTISTNDAILGLRSAKISAHVCNITKFKELRAIDSEIYRQRSSQKSCMLNDSTKCSRCSEVCPLTLLGF